MSKEFIRLSKSCLNHKEIESVTKVLTSEFLGMGQEVGKFEEMLTDFFGRPALCVSSGTSALHLALQAIGVGPGDEVLVQSLTYVASFQAISAVGAVPIACDVDLKTLCIDLNDAEKLITPRTKAIMPVHYSGGVGSLENVYDFSDRYGLRVIEDAAHAFGSLYKKKRVGGFGDIACFSFDGIKNITSGEGGCIVTSDIDVLKKVSDARLLGVERDAEKRLLRERSWDFDVSAQGWRYHMSDIMAAIGIEQLKKFPKFAKKRQELAKLYDYYFLNTDIKFIKHDYTKVVPHIYTVKIPNNINRDMIKNCLEKKGVQTGVHYQPNHTLSLYKNEVKKEVTDRLFKSILTLPLHPDLDKRDIEYISESLISLIQLKEN
jgi:dTDP-4-amino-4,6-dideoxygalactose transaminase